MPRRRYEEATQFFGEMNRLAPEIPGTHVRMDVGIAGTDFDNRQAHKTYPVGMPCPLEDAILLHRRCYTQDIACGFIHPEDDLTSSRSFKCRIGPRGSRNGPRASMLLWCRPER